MLNHNLNLQRFKVLYVTGNFSGILTRLHRRFTELDIRRGFTTFQLMTILEESHHSLIIIEIDPVLLQGLLGDGRVCLTGHETGISRVLYSSEIYPFLEDLGRLWNTAR